MLNDGLPHPLGRLTVWLYTSSPADMATLVGFAPRPTLETPGRSQVELPGPM